MGPTSFCVNVATICKAIDMSLGHEIDLVSKVHMSDMTVMLFDLFDTPYWVGNQGL